MIHRSRFPNFISRYETKLKLRPQDAERLLRDVEQHLPVYCYAPGRAVTFVSSVYYDTEDFFFYKRAKWFPHDNLKVRLKEYYYELPSGPELSSHCWIEVKRRLGQSTSKLRFRIDKEFVGPLFAADDVFAQIVASNSGLEAEHLRRIYEEFLNVVRGRSLRAHSVTNYRRRTFQQSGDESIRITFDDMIAYFRAPPLLFNGAKGLTRDVLGPPAGHQKQTVVEIKVARSSPDWLKELLRKYPETSFSKFLTSTQTLLPFPRHGERLPGLSETPEEERDRAGGAAWLGLERVARDPYFADEGEGPSSPAS